MPIALDCCMHLIGTIFEIIYERHYHCYLVDTEATAELSAGTKTFLTPGDYAVCEAYSSHCVHTFFAAFTPHALWNSHWPFPRACSDPKFFMAGKD